jgi:acetyl esterase/lipase
MEDRSVLERQASVPAHMAYGSDRDQIADVYAGRADLPLVMLIHGGYWRPDYDRIHLRPLAEAIADEGFSVCSVEYRRIPGDPDATVADIHSALTYPWSELPHAGRIGVGHSAGGHLLLVALSRGVTLDAAIALAPLADLRRARELELDDNAVHDFCGDRDDLDPMTLPISSVPLDIVHGDADERVPISFSREFATRVGTLHELPGVCHFGLIDPVHHAGQAVIALIQQRCVQADWKG